MENVKFDQHDDSKMNKLRSKILDYVKENPNDFHHLDVELLKTSDLWINRFLNFNKRSIDNAYSHLIRVFKQRNEVGIRSIDKSVMPLGEFLKDKNSCNG